MSGGDPGRLAALLELCRPVVDEIVVALDDRVDPALAWRAVELADSVVRVPYEPPPEALLSWLYGRCRGDWILKLDDDEAPSRALLDGLADAADASVTHVWLPRRWLYGGPRTYLAADPWLPDFQLRLSVNDPRLVRFPGLLHVPLEVAGPARYLDAPIYHLETLRPREERERKVEAYERERPGLRLAGLAFNHALYLPELRDAPLAEVPAEDQPLVEAIVGAPPARPGSTPELERAPRARARAEAAELEVVSVPRHCEAGDSVLVELRVRNVGKGALASPAVQIATRWDGAPGAWCALPAPLAPGREELVAAVVAAPAEPGRAELELRLVHDGVGWVGELVRVTIEVEPRRRVGVFVREATRDRAAELARAVVLAAPRLEPLVIGGADGTGYPTAVGPEPALSDGLAAGRRKLRSFLVAGRRLRALRRRGGPELAALVLAGLEATTLLERWSDLAAAAQASDRDAPVLVPPPPPPRGLLDRLLLWRLLRLRGVVVAEGELTGALAGFLDHYTRRNVSAG
jgi:hypothetical protein